MVTSDPSTRPSPPPEAAGEEAAAAGAVPEQPQGELGVLHVAVRQQQEVPDAAGRGQQAEGPQGPPQLGAAPYRRGELRGEGGVGGGRGEHILCFQPNITAKL